jgi:hypothetical protein
MKTTLKAFSRKEAKGLFCGPIVCFKIFYVLISWRFNSIFNLARSLFLNEAGEKISTFKLMQVGISRYRISE